jgi:hypothetical protein
VCYFEKMKTKVCLKLVSICCRFQSWDLENFRRVGIFYGRKSSRQARPTNLRSATPRQCDGFFLESRGLSHSSFAPTGNRARELLPNTVVGNPEISISDFSSAFIHPSPGYSDTRDGSSGRVVGTKNF